MPVREIPEKFLVAFSFAGEQRDLVRSIAEAVEERLGRSKVFLDEWYEHYIAGDDADLTLQDIFGERSMLAVVCVSESYGGKPWTLAEHAAIRARLMQSHTSANEGDRLGILPIRVGNGDVKGILFNTIVPDARKKTLDKTVELIVARLGLIAPEARGDGASPAVSPWPSEPVHFEHGLADREEQWPAIQKLMTGSAAKRILMFHGSTGYSKTALLNEAAHYAKILGIPYAFVDFKDTQLLSPANVLRRLRLDLGDVLPGFAAAKEPDSWALLEALRRLSSPALILLDTYEKITDSKELVEWIETQLLAEVEQCKQLRFLIGGQKVPNLTHARWGHIAEDIELGRINDKQVWKEWIQQKNPHVDDKHVEGIVLGLEGVPGTISTVLRTCAQNLNRTV